jgi:hypothetical protein
VLEQALQALVTEKAELRFEPQRPLVQLIEL